MMVFSLQIQRQYRIFTRNGQSRVSIVGLGGTLFPHKNAGQVMESGVLLENGMMNDGKFIPRSMLNGLSYCFGTTIFSDVGILYEPWQGHIDTIPILGYRPTNSPMLVSPGCSLWKQNMSIIEKRHLLWQLIVALKEEGRPWRPWPKSTLDQSSYHLEITYPL